MKLALKVSILGNLVLGTVVWVQANHRPTAVPAPQVSFERPAGDLAEPSLQANTRPALKPTGSQPFDWRQVEALDYPTYIVNLRAIHCPEQTIRDIIKADVGNLFALKRKESAQGGPSIDRWSQAQEARLVAALFGDPVDALSAGAPASKLALGTVVTQARLPLVLETEALAKLKLNDEQREELGELAQQFIEEIGGANQDPNDPAYLERWQRAQPKFDQMIVRAIGRRALVDLDEAMPAPLAGAHPASE